MLIFKRYKRVVRTYSSLKGSRADYLKNKRNAYDLVENRLKVFKEIYHVQLKRISIKNQKTRWGSCSKAGNLNFHYKILFLSPQLSDYIIVHELCHLKQFDHSKDFWEHVSLTIPDYKKLRKILRNMSTDVINLS
jgi:predicted metal-dependent hydrolase